MYNKLKQNEGIVLRPMLEQLDDLRTALLRENPAMLAVNQSIAQAAEQSYNISKLQSAGLLDAEAGAAKLSAISAQLTQFRAERRRLSRTTTLRKRRRPCARRQRPYSRARNGWTASMRICSACWWNRSLQSPRPVSASGCGAV
ncbi:MAG: hypothetical protein ACLRIS_22070 [Flavonifractor plautii]